MNQDAYNVAFYGSVLGLLLMVCAYLRSKFFSVNDFSDKTMAAKMFWANQVMFVATFAGLLYAIKKMEKRPLVLAAIWIFIYFVSMQMFGEQMDVSMYGVLY